MRFAGDLELSWRPQGRRAVLDRDCRWGPREETVVVFKLEVMGLELGGNGDCGRKGWMWRKDR